MATLHLDETIPEQVLAVEIGVCSFNFATKFSTVRLTSTGKPRADVPVDMHDTYEALTTDQKTTISIWYRQQVALSMNAKFGGTRTWQDIPDTIFDPEPEPDPPE